jgi:single-strand DNA-binding protein
MFCKIIIVGNLGRDPEMRYTPSGQPVTQFSVATSRKWTDRETNEPKEETTWFRVSVWGKQAEMCNEYLRKGRAVLVEADRIQANAYLKKDSGEAAASLEVTARSVRFLGGRGEGGGGGMGGGESEIPPGLVDEDSIPF